MKAKISIGWEPSLSVNHAYVGGDPKRGKTKAAKKAMWDIVMLLRPAVGYEWTWNGQKICVNIVAYRPTNRGDAQNLEKNICDAIEDALGVDDKYFVVTTVPELDRDNPRIVIEVSDEQPPEGRH